MSKTKLLKGECQHCGGHLEFPPEMAGLQGPCPHCGEQTDLLLAPPAEEPTVPRRTVIWAVIGIVILGLGLLGSLAALRRAEKWAARKKHQPEITSSVPGETNSVAAETSTAEGLTEQNDFAASAVTLETTEGTSRVYATGTLKNKTERKRFGVKVELDLLSSTDDKLGTATDYKAVIEPGAEWRFRALVLDAKATSARIASIKEEQ